MNNRIRRLVMLAIGLAGLLALLAEPAHASLPPNHCEPLLSEGGRP